MLYRLFQMHNRDIYDLITNPVTYLLIILSFLNSPDAFDKQEAPFNFEHHTIDSPLSGKSWGTGAFTQSDFDRDGDLYITLSRRTTTTVYWYEYEGPDQWIRHKVGRSDSRQLGGLTIDVNEDGYPDLVMGRIWFKNPGNLKESPDAQWIRYEYDGGLKTENHDLGAADFDLDGRQEVISYSQDANKGTLRLYNTTNEANWTFQDISTKVNSFVADRDEKGIHAGFAPNGIGDLDGDGDPDIVMPSGWFENPAKNGTKWSHNSWPFQVGIYSIVSYRDSLGAD